MIYRCFELAGHFVARTRIERMCVIRSNRLSIAG